MSRYFIVNKQSGYRSQSDSQGHEYVILNGEIVQVQDSKKNFVFCLRCKGIPEMYLAVEEEEVYYEWFSKLYSACNSGMMIISVFLIGS